MDYPATTVRKFRLKTMVLARALAEISVLLGMLSLPVIVRFTGMPPGLPPHADLIVYCCAAVALCLLPWFGFITFMVKITDSELEAVSLFQRQNCAWSQVKNVSRLSSYNWQRYVLELDTKTQITFPVLLENCDQLIAIVKSHMPAGAGGRSDPQRSFHNDPFAMAMQFMQLLLGLVFVAVCWLSCFSITSVKHDDQLFLIGFCVIATTVLLWRSTVVLLMPRRVLLEPEHLVVRNLFSERIYRWDQLRSVSAAYPLLPDGFTLRTRKWFYLIPASMSAVDELEEALKGRLALSAKPRRIK